MTLLAMTTAILLGVTAAQDLKTVPAGQLDALEKDLDAAKRQDYRSGREAIVAGYKAVITRHEGDPRVAEAMLGIAHSYDAWKDPSIGVEPDPEMALVWFRKAAATATKGSKLWTHANFMLVNRVMFKDTKEARQIVQVVADNANGNSLILAQVESTRLSICFRERPLDYATMEGHVKTLLHWYDDAKRIPKDDIERMELNPLVLGAASPLLIAYTTAPFPKEERERRIRALMKEKPISQWLQRDGQRALDLLSTQR